MPSKVRASLAGVTVSCGVISFDADLVPATKAKADKRAANSTALTRVCPTCTEGTKIKQRLICEHGHGPFPQTELEFATEVDGVLMKVDPDEVAEAKVPPVDAKTVSFSVFPAAQVEAVTLPSGNVYRLRLGAKPSRATMQAYALLRELVAAPDRAFLAELVVKGVSKLYRGIARDGMITLTELYRPSLFHVPDGADVEVDERTVGVGATVVAEMLQDFDPDAWESAAEARLAALQAAASKGSEATEVTEDAAKATEIALRLLALLSEAA